MNTFDPFDINTDTQVTVQLPRLIAAMDYHDFKMIQSIIEHDLGVSKVFVTEVGFENAEYIALIHLDCESHNQLVQQLTDHYQSLQNS